MGKLSWWSLMLVVGCAAPSEPVQELEQLAADRLAVALDRPEYLRVQSARAAKRSGGGEEIICGTVSYNRAGVPSAGAERFVIFPGNVAIEGQPTKTFTFEHLYGKEGKCAD